MDWKASGTKKKAAIDSLIPQKWRIDKVPAVETQKDVTAKYIQGFLTAREIEITETDAVGIVEKTTSGIWKAREVAEAFCHRAALAHQMVNCLHEIFFQPAIEDAQRLDDYLTEHKKPIGPLHGLPVSLKDQFHVKGVETTMGYVGWIGTFEGRKGSGKETVFESEMVRELREMGAILYCKTSVPHTLMSGETINNIIEYTWNPKNRYLSSGGSSGGEGALIGLKGSPVGFGTDIGGSIRIPAAFNGLYGIRPSSGRMPYEGMANSMDGQNSVLSVAGPLATSVGGLRLVIKGILSQQPWLHDPLVHEIPWRDETEQAILDIIKSNKGGPLVFGVLRNDGLVTPHPPVRRAIEIVATTIQKLGHKVIEWTPPSHAQASDLLVKIWKFDGGTDIHSALALSSEPPIHPVQAFFGSSATTPSTASEIAATNVLKRNYQKAYLDYWNSTADVTGTGRPVDAVVTPAAATAATRPENLRVIPAYTGFVNLLDYTAGVVPITTVDKRVDVVDKEFKALNDTDAGVQGFYDPEVYDGAHVAVQIVGRRLQEEKVLALMEMIGDAVGKHIA